MKLCPRCNAKVDVGAIYCPNCGYTASQVPLHSATPSPKKNNLLLPLGIVGGILGLCALCGLLGGIGNLLDKSAENQPPVTNTTIPASRDISSTPAVTANKATPSAPKETISSIKWAEYDNVYNTRSNSTDMQKEALWKNFEGQTVAWQGTVAEVREGTFGGLVLNIKMNSETLTHDITLNLKDSEKSKAMSLIKGTKVSFVGMLKTFGGAILPLQMDEGEIR